MAHQVNVVASPGSELDRATTPILYENACLFFNGLSACYYITDLYNYGVLRDASFSLSYKAL